MIESRHVSHVDRRLVAWGRILGATIVLLAGLAFQSSPRAVAAYCGSSADTSALEALAVARGLSNSTRIMDVVVVQDYARVDVQSKGRLTEYYVKDCGKWRFSGSSVPENAPSSVSSQLTAFVPRDDGGTQCLNPGFVNHPSGA